MNEKEIVEFWGSENLIRWSKDAIQHLRISEASKAFLTNVGLPAPKNDRLWKYDYDFSMDGPTKVPGKEALVAITSLPRPFCIEEGLGGSIILPYIETDIERFVNSTVEQFVAFLSVFEQGRKEMLRLGDTEQEPFRRLIYEIEESMRNIDPAALKDENNYWSVVLEDMRYPYLTDAEVDAL